MARKKTAGKSAPAAGGRRKGSKKAASKAPARKPAARPAPRKPAAAPAKKPPAPKPAAKAAARSESRKAPAKSRGALKKAELSRFREQMIQKLGNLVGDLRSMESQAFKTSGQDTSANHMADYGSDNYEQEFTLGLIENDEEIVRQIHAAIARIDRGEYGICQGCSQPIPVARLEVLPWVPYCVPCQEQTERF